MRFRLGLVAGFGAGYYLGAKAGRERYEQLNAMVRRARRSEAFGTVTERAREVVDRGAGHQTNGSVPPIDLAEPRP